MTKLKSVEDTSELSPGDEVLFSKRLIAGSFYDHWTASVVPKKPVTKPLRRL